MFFPTPPPPQVEVVDGWEHHFDETAQAWYWFDPETGEAAWEEYEEAVVEEDDDGKDKKGKKGKKGKNKDKKDKGKKGDKKGAKKKKK